MLWTNLGLYVLRDDSVRALIDTLDRGDLLVAKSGFGLLEKSCLRWFDQEGAFLGSILSKASKSANRTSSALERAGTIGRSKLVSAC